ncbi:transmembrane protein 117-like [Dreissena polymorpha]|uniref:Transmembrane protein 117 n=1 Tax=Dreissena polymorpha TaxID=45954 RepID=A0A9D4CLL8_DREPO|nr:transmembrane protein 117-like [Dreissena polymorpha]KAH3727635.1 hypothetical protein DPMN_053574 [Dreissena polymorpha]
MGNASGKENQLEQLDPLTDLKNSKERSQDMQQATGQKMGAKNIEDDINAELELADAGITDDLKSGINNNRDNADEALCKDELLIKPDESYEIGKATNVAVDVVDAGKDDVDVASTYSLFMAKKDFRYYFQHPYSRLVIAYLVVFCNFLIYAEDPVAHSRKECLIPMIGNDVAFICTRYPPNAWSLLKVAFWLVGLIVGLFLGKLFVHGFLFNRLLRLRMFRDSQGSWMVMFLISLITIFIMSCVYNLFLMIGGDSTSDWRISDLMGVSNAIFMKVSACGTWCGDFFTAWMVTDIMLQEKLYPGWAQPVRRWWRHRFNRIILFWLVVSSTSFAVVFAIATDYINWDQLNRDFMATNELSRSFLASFILVMDLLIVMQDWDFPHFVSALDIKLPGVNTAHIRFSIPKCLKRETWDIHITGKWFNYGILFMVMLLDLNMWKNQIFYNPYDYGQYVNNDGRIYTVQDEYSLEKFNASQITYEFRSTEINPNTNRTFISDDTHMNTKYLNYALGAKAMAFIPSIIAFIVFGVLIWYFGREKPTEEKPYAGRLKKRPKRRFSDRLKFQMPWRKREEERQKIHAVPKLLYFRRKGAKHVEEEKQIPIEAFIDKMEVTNDQNVVTVTELP